MTPDGRTVYATDGGWNFDPAGVHKVIPISTTSNRLGKPIRLTNPADDPNPAHRYSQLLVITPDGRTVLAADGRSPVIIPIETATGTPGAPIKVAKPGTGPYAIAVTPDGKTAIAGSDRSLYALNVTDNTVITKIKLTHVLTYGMAFAMDGKTAWLSGARNSWNGPAVLVPVNTATYRAGKPIPIDRKAIAGCVLLVPPRPGHGRGLSYC